MNPAYEKSRFRAKLPKDGLPQAFGVMTACNPNGKTIPGDQNHGRGREFQQLLDERGLKHFPVTGYDPESGYGEPGFGVVCDAETARALGAELQQEAVFHVLDGDVMLLGCGPEAEKIPLGRWEERADPGSRD